MPQVAAQPQPHVEPPTLKSSDSGAFKRRRPPAVPAPRSPLRARLLNYVLGFVTIVLVVDALVGDKGLVDTIRARRQHQALAAALAQKRQENSRLRENIRRLKEDPGAIESLAREELGLMREGEVLFIVRDVKSDR